MKIRFEATLSGTGHSLIVDGFPRDFVISPNSSQGFVSSKKYLFEFESIGTCIRLVVRKNPSNFHGVEIFNSPHAIYEIGRSGVWEFDSGGSWEWLRPVI